MAALAVEYKDRGVLAFDLAGAEIDNPAKWFREAFYLVRDANLNVTVHAGEAYGPESIHQALHYTGAHRIGHGVRLRETRTCSSTRSSDSARNVSVVKCPDRRSRFDRGASHQGIFRPRPAGQQEHRQPAHVRHDDDQRAGLLVEHLEFNLEDVKKLLMNGFKSAFLRYPSRKA